MIKIGFCGAGPMGVPMVLRLRQAGHPVAVWNRTPGRLSPLIDMGAVPVDAPADMSDCAAVFLCVRDATAVEEVVFGPNGVAALRGPRWLVDHSTIGPDATRAFAERLAGANGMAWIDAPVTGGSPGAYKGTLVVLAGGPAEPIDALRLVMGAYAARVNHMGPTGAGQATKLCNQAIASTTIVAIAEALVLAERAGIQPGALAGALAGGWADSVLLQTFAPRMNAPTSDVIGTVATMLKDMDAVAAQARAVGAPLLTVAAAQQAYGLSVANHLGELDVSQVIRLFRGGAADGASSRLSSPENKETP